MSPRLIATDLDGTLLDDDERISPRNRAALDAARAAGIAVVPVTARQPIGIRSIAADAGFDGWALSGGGASAVHLGTGQVLFEASVPVPVQTALAVALRQTLPEVLFASVRDGGDTFVAQDGYAALARPSDHKRDPATMGTFALEQVLAQPSLKLVVRHPVLDNDALIAAIGDLQLTGFAVTHSGAPFVEVLADGVGKAWGLSRLCAHWGIAALEVLAFGDAPNDAEMLAWAGHGVAVAGAAAVTLAAADEVTASNNDDGVARVIERTLALAHARR